MRKISNNLMAMLFVLIAACSLVLICSYQNARSPEIKEHPDAVNQDIIDSNELYNDEKNEDEGVSHSEDQSSHTVIENFDYTEYILSFKYAGEPYEILNNNEPFFTEIDYSTEAFERYSALDSLGRCGSAFANIGIELMPTEERTAIGQIKPTGWHTIKYNDIIEGNYLYNRCHLIAYELTGENSNERNLITGTRYLNIKGMLPFENSVADYIMQSGNHVLYRITPVYENDNLVASGVIMEAASVEDDKKGICFNVYVYNVQPGIVIDYRNGDSWRSDIDILEQPNGLQDDVKYYKEASKGSEKDGLQNEYVINTNTKKFHIPSCESVGDIKCKFRPNGVNFSLETA